MRWNGSKGKGHVYEQLPELNPGIDYAAFGIDPDGYAIPLYCPMEQLDWEGKHRPVEHRRKIETPWPEMRLVLEDTYADQTSMGPLG